MMAMVGGQSWAWMLWNVVDKTSRISTFLQILVFLPLTLSTLSKTAFLLLSFLLSCHAIIHGLLITYWGAPALSIMQLPIHPALLLVCFNMFSSTVPSWITTLCSWWESLIWLGGPFFVLMESMSTLLVAQKLGQDSKKLLFEHGEPYQFALLLASAIAYVISAYSIVVNYPAAASKPLSSTFLGSSITVLLFLTVIGFALRRTNIIETSAMALSLAFNVWLCGFENTSFHLPVSYLPLRPIVPTLVKFITKTIPPPLLAGLVYRISVLSLASRILPNIPVPDADTGDESAETPALTLVLTRFQQFLFITMLTHFTLLDHSSHVWWRWMSVFFSLIMWSIELLVSTDDEDVKWKID